MNDLINNPLLLGFIILCIATLVLLGLVIWMWLKLRRFLVGVDANHIGESLQSVSGDLGELKTFRDELEKYLKTVEKRLRKSVQAVHTVRFNPWSGTGEGGNQSFATAFMNEEGDGVVISSLYARDHVSIFGKSLKKHGSEHELSGEEKKAVEEAKRNLE
ncbi:MAG: DUF4446 family protein [Candidatus Paceibacterota bacterium]